MRMTKRGSPNLPIGANIKIAMFHLGSGMADVLATGVWNRIMVADLGFSATFVGLLTGLRYFLAPIGVIAGRYSDTHTVGGFRRLFWIWLGRAMMAISTVTLGFATAELIQRAQFGNDDPTPLLLWLALVLSFLLFSLGNAISGSTFLALIYDRAAEHQRGRAVGLVWTFLLLGFTAGGILFSIMLPQEESAGEIAFSAASLLSLFLATAAILSLLWFFSLLGEEKRLPGSLVSKREPTSSLRRDLSLVWHNRSMRFFLFYLTLSMAFAFLQDTVLEPFAGQVFDLSASVTNRFSAYWGGMAIIGSFATLYLSRRYASFTSNKISQAGLLILLIAYAGFALSSLGEIRELVTPALLMLGLGLGIWNIGTLGLMMNLSPAGRAGTFLGFWTFCVTLARGGGVAGGGIIRDAVLQISGELSLSYGAVFCLGIIGLLIAWYALQQVKTKDTRSKIRSDADLATVFSNSID